MTCLRLIPKQAVAIPCGSSTVGCRNLQDLAPTRKLRGVKNGQKERRVSPRCWGYCAAGGVRALAQLSFQSCSNVSGEGIVVRRRVGADGAWPLPPPPPAATPPPRGAPPGGTCPPPPTAARRPPPAVTAHRVAPRRTPRGQRRANAALVAGERLPRGGASCPLLWGWAWRPPPWWWSRWDAGGGGGRQGGGRGRRATPRQVRPRLRG